MTSQPLYDWAADATTPTRRFFVDEWDPRRLSITLANGKPSPYRAARLFSPSVIDWIQITLFGAVDLLALIQVYKLICVHRQQTHSSIQLTGGRRRSFLILLLFVANLSRAISVGLLLHLGDSASIWTITLIETAPTLLFLSTYSVVILFWSQVYYAAILVTVPLLRVTFVFLSFAIYFLYAITAIVTAWMRAPISFEEDTQILFGAAYSLVALGVFYYGLKVAGQLSDGSQSLSRKSGIIRRVITLALVCPIIFILRAFYSFTIGLHIESPYLIPKLPPRTCDALVNVISDFLPSVLILVTFWNRKSPQVSARAEVTAPLIQHNYTARQYLPQADAAIGQVGEYIDCLYAFQVLKPQEMFIPRVADQPLFAYPTNLGGF